MRKTPLVLLGVLILVALTGCSATGTGSGNPGLDLTLGFRAMVDHGNTAAINNAEAAAMNQNTAAQEDMAAIDAEVAAGLIASRVEAGEAEEAAKAEAAKARGETKAIFMYVLLVAGSVLVLALVAGASTSWNVAAPILSIGAAYKSATGGRMLRKGEIVAYERPGRETILIHELAPVTPIRDGLPENVQTAAIQAAGSKAIAHEAASVADQKKIVENVTGVLAILSQKAQSTVEAIPKREPVQNARKQQALPSNPKE